MYNEQEYKHIIWEWFQLRDAYLWIIEDIENEDATTTAKLCAYGYIYEVVI